MESCPCTYITPCNSQCSCANPILSGGCSRCCMHGSESQRKSSAERLAVIEKLAYESIDGNSLINLVIDAVESCCKHEEFSVHDRDSVKKWLIERSKRKANQK